MNPDLRPITYENRAGPGLASCPLCRHPWMHHDVMEMDDTHPTCCVEGCDCGRKPGEVIARQLAPCFVHRTNVAETHADAILAALREAGYEVVAAGLVEEETAPLRAAIERYEREVARLRALLADEARAVLAGSTPETGDTP